MGFRIGDVVVKQNFHVVSSKYLAVVAEAEERKQRPAPTLVTPSAPREPNTSPLENIPLLEDKLSS